MKLYWSVGIIRYVHLCTLHIHVQHKENFPVNFPPSLIGQYLISSNWNDTFSPHPYDLIR